MFTKNVLGLSGSGVVTKSSTGNEGQKDENMQKVFAKEFDNEMAKIGVKTEKNGHLGHLCHLPISGIDTLIRDSVGGRVGDIGDLGDQKIEDFSNILDTTISQNEISTGNVRPTILPQITEKKLETLEDFTNKYKDYVKKEESLKPQKKEKQKEKTDRELQYYESPETKDIIVQCTREQVLDWIKVNPGVSFKTMYETLGRGSFKYTTNLLKENLIKASGEGWSVSND